MPGCGQQVLAPEVNEATVRLLTRHDVEVVNAAGSGCCGSSVLHLGRKEDAVALAKRNIEAWLGEADGAGLDAIIVNASGCGTTVKDYGHLLADDPVWRERAEQVAALARDISEFMVEIGLVNVNLGNVGLRNVSGRPLTVAYHSACSMQHGQKVIEQPKKLLRDAGFVVKDVPEGHLCCGWAGTYQILQPELSRRLRERKAANIESVHPDIIATGNFGCIGNISAATAIPMVHTVELLDWATGGPKPRALTAGQR
jgi:glycolate oxidase iron-sulfur subunit